MGGMNSLSHSSARIGFRMTMNAGDVAPEIPKNLALRSLFMHWRIGWLGLVLWVLSRLLARGAVPEPIAQWTFEGDVRDSIGGMHGELLGEATLAGGRLVLKGNGHVRTAPLAKDLAAKTLVARVKVDPLSQREAGVMAVATVDGYTYDSIVYGEGVPGEWNPGSPGYVRSQQLADAFPEERNAGMVQMAITYADDGTTSVYRNGIPYGRPFQKTTGPWLFGAGASEVLFGRNSTAANPYLQGEIEEAALYDRALTPAEVSELAGITPNVEPNLIANGSFESGSLSPWQETLQPNAPTQLSTVVTESAAQGRFSLAPGILLLSQRVSTDPGREYVLAFAYAGRGFLGSFRVLINGVDLGAESMDLSLPSLLHSSELGSKGTWAYASRRFIATASTTVVAFDFSQTPYLQALLDDVRVYPAETQVPEMTVEWAGEPVTVREGESATVTVRRSGPLDQRGFAAVELRTGTATVSGELPDLDLSFALPFVPQSFGRRMGLTFLPGQAEVPVTLRGRADSELEPTETATLHLLPTGNASVRGNPVAVTVLAAPTRITASGSAYEEGVGGGQIVLQVEKGSGGRVRVQSTAEGTATPGLDFLPIDQEFDVVPGRAAFAPIQVLRDNLIEGAETINFRVTPLSDQTEVVPAVLSVPLADDLYVEPSSDSTQVSEAVGVVRFSLVRRGSLDSPQVFHVRYRLEGREGLGDNEGHWASAARPGLDFQAQEGVVEFGPGITRQTLELPLLNNTDADGPHGLTLRLEGSREIPLLRAQGEAFVVIADDEHDALRQHIRLLNSLEDSESYPILSPTPAGGTLVVHGRQITRLTATGVPDLSFGKGDGQMQVPLIGSRQIRPVSAIQLPDGGVIALADASDDIIKTMVIRLKADGTTDPSFGDGAGNVTLTNWVAQVLPTQPDGFLLSMIDANDQHRFFQRLDSKGAPVSGPVLEQLSISSEDRVSLIAAPDGAIWVSVEEEDGWSNPWFGSISGSATLGRLLPDGRPDAEFGLQTDVSPFFGFDALGRAYFGLKPQGGLIRFLPDGAYDTSYRPSADMGRESLFCQVFADGSTVLTQSGNLISEFGPDGTLKKRFDLTAKLIEVVQPMHLTYNQLQVASAIRQTDGTLMIDAGACLFSRGEFGWSRSCYGLRYRVTSGGDWRPIFLPDDASIRTGGSSPIWLSMGNGNEDVWRYLAPSASPQIGLPITGLVCRESSIRIPVQRTGSTADQAEVLGRILPWNGNRWDDALAIPFAGRFTKGSADVSIEVFLPSRTTRPSVRDYLVRLDKAPGLEVSSFNECRIWVLDELLVPQPGSLILHSPTGPNPPEISWLLASPPTGGAAHLMSSVSLNDGEWIERGFQDAIKLDSVMIQPLSKDAFPAEFYRLIY